MRGGVAGRVKDASKLATPLFSAALGSSVSGTERIEDSKASARYAFLSMLEDDVKTSDPILYEWYGIRFLLDRKYVVLQRSCLSIYFVVFFV